LINLLPLFSLPVISLSILSLSLCFSSFPSVSLSKSHPAPLFEATPSVDRKQEKNQKEEKERRKKKRMTQN
jgi:hypothetical protein